MDIVKVMPIHPIAMSRKVLPFSVSGITFTKQRVWGRTGFDGDVETRVAGRGAAGLVKSGTQVIANNDDYAYAYAA